MTEAGRVAERGSIGKACFATGVVSLLATFSGVPLLFGLVFGDYFPAPIDWYVFVASGSIGLALALRPSRSVSLDCVSRGTGAYPTS
jgi:hypothetical protein